MNEIEDHVETAYCEVQAAERELSQLASKVKGSLYPLVGALLGTCVGGPVGFAAGLKVGALVAVTGSVLGNYSQSYILKSWLLRTQHRIQSLILLWGRGG